VTAMGTIHRALATAGALLAVTAAAVGTPTPPERGGSTGQIADAARTTPQVVGARQLAEWIRDGGRRVRVLDLRGDSAYETRHVPSAEPADLAVLDTLATHRDETLVLYSDDDVRDTQAWANLAARGHERAYVLSGGLQAWTEEVMEATLHGDSADYVAALSRYFGGAPRAAGERAPAAPPGVRQRDDRPVTDAFGDAERRGC
jgi:rhodanese-related sulfurtransferase